MQFHPNWCQFLTLGRASTTCPQVPLRVYTADRLAPDVFGHGLHLVCRQLCNDLHLPGYTPWAIWRQFVSETCLATVDCAGLDYFLGSQRNGKGALGWKGERAKISGGALPPPLLIPSLPVPRRHFLSFHHGLPWSPHRETQSHLLRCNHAVPKCQLACSQCLSPQLTMNSCSWLAISRKGPDDTVWPQCMLVRPPSWGCPP